MVVTERAVNCKYCGKALPRYTVTVRREFCDDAHRVAYHRQEKRKKRQIQTIYGYILELGRESPKSAAAHDELVAINKLVEQFINSTF